MTSNDATDAQLLRDARLRVTALRLATLRAVGNRPHTDADTVATAVRADLGTASVQGVYDALRVLTEGSLLRRIEPAGHPARYERRTLDNHHHLVCRTCGTVVDVDCVVGAAPCLVAGDEAGFVIDQAEVTFWGLCPDCATPRADASTENTGSTA